MFGRTSFLLLVVALWIQGAERTARAQCSSNASSCLGCHEVQRQRPVLELGAPWHRDHGFGDLCASCHGGVSDDTTLAGAHVGLRAPLAAPASTCGSCHQQDFDTRVAAYRGWTPPAPSVPVVPVEPSATPAASETRTVDLALALLSLVLAATIAIVVRRRRREAPGKRLTAWLRTALWSPYAAGAGLGIVVAISELVCGRPIAVSGAFDKLAAYPGRALFPDSQYYTHVISPGITWQVWLVVGLLAGSFLASRLAREARWRWLPDSQWVPRFGPSRARRLLLAFIGAGIAGGCTSGLAISGGAVLAPAAFLFMAGMFAGGIPTARLWYLGRRD
jgi:uncharacterized protein